MKPALKKLKKFFNYQRLKSFTIFTVLIFLFVSFHSGEQRIFTVNTTDDNLDHDLADDICADVNGLCTLRAAIQNANKTRAKDLINFNVSGRGPFKISLKENLPEIIEPVFLDATSQKGYSLLSPQIILSGEKIIPESYFHPVKLGTEITGFQLAKRSAGSTIKGFVIGGFGLENFIEDGKRYPIYPGYGILIHTGGNRIVGNYIGIAADGNSKFSNIWGVGIRTREKNYIGGKEPQEKNIISGNYLAGIFIYSQAEILGNYIGTNNLGDCAVRNSIGIDMVYFSEKNIIKDNLISGNSTGIYVMGRTNLVLNNLVGTDKEGKLPLPNQTGILLKVTRNNVIAENNVISGNKIGVEIFETIYGGPQNNHIRGNFIGTDISGTYAIPNETGILIKKGQDNIIGGVKPDHRNIISGNSSVGINLEGTKNNFISGNFIGTDLTGRKALPNSTGILFSKTSGEDSQSNLVMGNLLSGNSGNGVAIKDGKFNSIVDNFIGTNEDLVTPLPNRGNGVLIYSASVENCIGGQDPENSNIIAFNNGFGILVKNEKLPIPPNEQVRLLHNKVFENCKADIFFAESQEGLD